MIRFNKKLRIYDKMKEKNRQKNKEKPAQLPFTFSFFYELQNHRVPTIFTAKCSIFFDLSNDHIFTSYVLFLSWSLLNFVELWGFLIIIIVAINVLSG